METVWKVIEIVMNGIGNLELSRETFLVASTMIDLVAVAGLGWIVVRGGRQRDAAVAEQQATLAALRTDLAELLADAERRAHALEESLADREQSLRGLLVDVGRAEEKRPVTKRTPSPRTTPQPPPPSAAAAVPRPRPAGLDALRGDLAQIARKLNVDPAEARLLRDLEVSLGAKQG